MSYILEKSTFRAFAKFHRETGCGEKHLHWAECQAAVQAWGYETWEEWVTEMQAADELLLEPGVSLDPAVADTDYAHLRTEKS